MRETGGINHTCAFARRISKPFRNFEMGLESGKLRILSITTSSCRWKKRFGYLHGNINHLKSQGTEREASLKVLPKGPASQACVKAVDEISRALDLR